MVVLKTCRNKSDNAISRGLSIYQQFNPIVKTAWNKHCEHNLLTACQQTTLFTIFAFLLMYLYCLFPGSW